jgi:hypothetical protein
VALPIGGSDTQYFLRTSEPGTSIYQPESATEPARGSGTVRIREIMAESDEVTILTGTLVTQERLEFSRNDLLWLRMEMRGGHFDLYVRLDETQAMAAGEWRFRSIPLRLIDSIREMLNEAQGVPISNVRFELLPLLSTPHDLYACGVLAVRSLLVDADNSLPVALDETMSLAKQLAVEYEESVSLRDRIEAIFLRDPRWLESLGPQRLTHRECTARDALDLVPAELWYDTLGMVVRMFPGLGPDSICRDFADAPIGGIHRVFEPVWTDLESLLRRTRSLIVIDWRYNREISSVIRRYGIGQDSSPAGMIS